MSDKRLPLWPEREASFLTKLLAYCVTGAFFGAVLGATFLAGWAWKREGPNGSDEQSQWAFVGMFLGIKLGILFGALGGAIIGIAVAAVKRYLRAVS